MIIKIVRIIVSVIGGAISGMSWGFVLSIAQMDSPRQGWIYCLPPFIPILLIILCASCFRWWGIKYHIIYLAGVLAVMLIYSWPDRMELNEGGNWVVDTFFIWFIGAGIITLAGSLAMYLSKAIMHRLNR